MLLAKATKECWKDHMKGFVEVGFPKELFNFDVVEIGPDQYAIFIFKDLFRSVRKLSKKSRFGVGEILDLQFSDVKGNDNQYEIITSSADLSRMNYTLMLTLKEHREGRMNYLPKPVSEKRERLRLGKEKIRERIKTALLKFYREGEISQVNVPDIFYKKGAYCAGISSRKEGYSYTTWVSEPEEITQRVEEFLSAFKPRLNKPRFRKKVKRHYR